MTADNNNPRLAVLIDADNTFKVMDLIDELFEETDVLWGTIDEEVLLNRRSRGLQRSVDFK